MRYGRAVPVISYLFEYGIHTGAKPLRRFDFKQAGLITAFVEQVNFSLVAIAVKVEMERLNAGE
ncbi:MAG: hypothetical protein AAGJ82_02935 [Bacteroidota bacterium]